MRFSRALAACILGASCAHGPSISRLAMPQDASFRAAAPDSFDVDFKTTKGTMRVRARRWWSPNGVDRLYAMVRSNYFDSVAFHRTIKGFVAQFGITGDTAVNRAWRGSNIQDEQIRVTNQRGTLSFARGGPNSRSTQLFFNWVDNARLDTANTFGFPPIAQIIGGLAVIDSLNWEYSGQAGQRPAPQGPAQNRITAEGNAYLKRDFPRLDYIISTRLVHTWGKKEQ